MPRLTRRIAQLVNDGFGTHRGLVRFLLGEAEYVAGRVECFLAPDPRRVRRLVFVCLGNINRSAFAQAIATRLGMPSASFGLVSSTGQPAFPLAIRTAPLFGIDLSAHRSTDTTDYRREEGDLLVAMEIRHARTLIEAGYSPADITLLGHWARPHRVHIHDPHTLGDEYFKTCFTIIQSGVINLVAFLREGGCECVRH